MGWQRAHLMRLINDNALCVFVLSFGFFFFSFFRMFGLDLLRICLGLTLDFFFFLGFYNFLFFFFSESLLHFFFFQILVQSLFCIKILKVLLILLEGVSIFFKAKQIKKFKLFYIYILQVREVAPPLLRTGSQVHNLTTLIMTLFWIHKTT